MNSNLVLALLYGVSMCWESALDLWRDGVVWSGVNFLSGWNCGCGAARGATVAIERTIAVLTAVFLVTVLRAVFLVTFFVVTEALVGLFNFFIDLFIMAVLGNWDGVVGWSG